jgi:predicted site-specific integrase-resolvase
VIDADVDIEALMQKDTWTIAEAATAAQVTVDAIHKWRRRGHLPDAGRDRQGRIKVRAVDVIRAERATREKARRVYAAA